MLGYVHFGKQPTAHVRTGVLLPHRVTLCQPKGVLAKVSKLGVISLTDVGLNLVDYSMFPKATRHKLLDIQSIDIVVRVSRWQVS